MPDVTVLMPVYNAERYLRPAIESILNQTFTEFEFLILNDGSTDSSRAIISSYSDKRIRLVDNERNLGLTRTLNRGLKLAQFELVARQDADDISHPRRLELQMEFLLAHPDVTLLGTQGWVIDQFGRYRGPVFDRAAERESIRWDLLFDNNFLHTSVVFKRRVVLEELGGYDESFSYCQDFELWSRVALGHTVANLSARLVNYRIHPASLTETLRSVSEEENRRIIHRNMIAVLGPEAVTNEEVDLILRHLFTKGFEASSLQAFLKVFSRLREQYLNLYPAVRASRDFRLTIARRYLKLLCKVFAANPALAPGVLAGSAGFPVAAVAFSWLKAFALSLYLDATRGYGRSVPSIWRNSPQSRTPPCASDGAR